MIRKKMELFKQLFSKRWWWLTIVAVIAAGVMVRLGIWQLDRLAWRQTYNRDTIAQLTAPELRLDSSVFDEPLETMAYRSVVVEGEYDFANEVALRNQVWNGLPGYTLLTPLKIEGTDQYVIVNRGWVPNEGDPVGAEAFFERGQVSVYGMIRASETEPQIGRRSDPKPAPGERLTYWNLANLEQIESQLPYDLLPIYIQRGPDSQYPQDLELWTPDLLPYPGLPTIEISEGSHLVYAIQWFVFASFALIGYPILVWREMNSKE